ncbi:MAG: hypothetical protein IPP45_00785 [Sphingomonadales bacterium]|nr:hypothetical protein [Sphingomonadales bacterium]
MKVAYPKADIPVIEMSLDKSLDPALHLPSGRALTPLRSEGTLFIGSGKSFRDMRAYRTQECNGAVQGI